MVPLPQVPLLYGVGLELVLQQPPHQRKVFVQIVGVGYVLERHLQELLPLVADDLGHVPVDTEPAAVDPDLRRTDGGVLEGALKRSSLLSRRSSILRRSEMSFWHPKKL